MSGEPALTPAQQRGTDDEIPVLYVDDNRELLEVATEFLEREREPLCVTPVTSASAALDRLGRTPDRFDCVVSDLQMPDRDGLDLLAAVREEYPSLPFILHTNVDAEGSVREALRAGATDYLHKGSGAAHYARLATRIERAVDRYRAERTAAGLEAALSRVAETIPGAVALLDPDGRCRYVGPETGSVLGRGPDELRGERLPEYLHPDDRPQAAVLWSASAGESDCRSVVDVRVERPDGSWQRVTCLGWGRVGDRLAGVELHARNGDSGGDDPPHDSIVD